jgi:hypothetical protein
MAKTPPVGVRLDPHLKIALERAAVDDQRSLSAMIAKILSDWLKRKDKEERRS